MTDVSDICQVFFNGVRYLMSDKKTESIAARLQSLRKPKDTLRQTAREWDLPVETLRGWLRDPGGHVPDMNRLYELGRLLGVSPHWIITGEGPQSADEFKAALKRIA
jgi:hypothetical protein